MANRERLTMVCGQIALQPERHEQTRYFRTERIRTGAQMQNSCGTTGCFAGHAVFMFGDQDALYSGNDDSGLFKPSITGNYVLDPWDNRVVPYDTWEHGGLRRLHRVPVREEAKTLLGLTDDQASWLFAGERTKDQLFAGVARILEKPNISKQDLDYYVRVEKGLSN